MTQCNLWPVGGSILVQMEDVAVGEAAGLKKSTILLPLGTKQNLGIARVLRCGEGGMTPMGAPIPMPVQPGDRVLILKARMIQVDEMDPNICLAMAGDVFAIVKEELLCSP